jgi:hypothetical protein
VSVRYCGLQGNSFFGFANLCTGSGPYLDSLTCQVLARIDRQLLDSHCGLQDALLGVFDILWCVVRQRYILGSISCCITEVVDDFCVYADALCQLLDRSFLIHGGSLSPSFICQSDRCLKLDLFYSEIGCVKRFAPVKGTFFAVAPTWHLLARLLLGMVLHHHIHRLTGYHCSPNTYLGHGGWLSFGRVTTRSGQQALSILVGVDCTCRLSMQGLQLSL